ncbi:MurR/RpiR family transcriptional regulator [Cohnella thailandensis]|uniref:MurR/RpiR family transcriptional regulator n=1 Tax=Cohnella thailandensis TaxID=557557 RepID=A0A841SU29_9BACL|nr:MurR/RpiR family transcriptional regulator [Cohnella thailandensis]MBB6635434.1 MurR/RpiR family transcriptional regulator [Cohnella thailandensis]MBP1974814.1 DNA-binding MurR/RpiR family transcriptional regulator [Cohnella thailandensis]
MLKGGLISLKTAISSLKPTEQKAAQYIVEHPEEVVNSSVQKVAALADVSEATIIRLCRSLNYKGFQELKLRIAADLSDHSEMEDSYQEIQIEGPIADLVASISHNNMRSIQDTLSVLSNEELEKAIDVMSRAKKIAIFGVGASAVIAMDLKQKLTRINYWCETGLGLDEQTTLAANMDERDVAFGISYSGQTTDVIDSLALARENGAATISLTRLGSNPVAAAADINLFTSSLENSIRSGAMASRIAQLNVIDILYVGIARKNHERHVRFLEKTRKAVRNKS